MSNTQRLGEQRQSTGEDGRTRTRAIKVTLTNASDQKPLLGDTKLLKELPEPFSKIYVKRDMHPGVRREFLRLRNAEKTEGTGV